MINAATALVRVVVVCHGEQLVAVCLASELAPFEQEVEVHQEALDAETLEQLLVDSVEHSHEALLEPRLHVATTVAARQA